MRGFGGDDKQRFLREMVFDMKIDFLGLQETMRQTYSRNDLQKICAGRDFHWHHTPSRGKSGGLLMGINYTTLDVISQEDGEYYIKSTVQDVKTGLFGILCSFMEMHNLKEKQNSLQNYLGSYMTVLTPPISILLEKLLNLAPQDIGVSSLMQYWNKLV